MAKITSRLWRESISKNHIFVRVHKSKYPRFANQKFYFSAVRYFKSGAVIRIRICRPKCILPAGSNCNQGKIE